MDFKQYQYVLRVAELKSITKAAQSLYVSQPSLSAFIAKTEEELGATIFDRNKTPLELTLAGEIFVETGRSILKLHEKMKGQIIEISQNKRGRLRVGIPGSRAAYMLPLIYPAFHRAFPGVDLKMTEANSTALLSALQKGDMDIAVIPQCSAGNGLFFELIYQEELLLISKKGFLRKEDYKQPGVADIPKAAAHPFILLKRGHGVRRAVDDFFSKHGIVPKILLETGNNSTALRMAIAGEGLAIVPRMTIEISGNMEGAEMLHLTPQGLFWDITAVRRVENRDDYMQNEFTRIARHVFQGV